MATVIGYTGNRVRIAAIGDKKVDLTMDHLEVAKMLIDNDADVLAVDKESKTALVCAHERFKSGKTVGDDMVRLLEESAKSKKSPQ